MESEPGPVRGRGRRWHLLRGPELRVGGGGRGDQARGQLSGFPAWRRARRPTFAGVLGSEARVSLTVRSRIQTGLTHTRGRDPSRRCSRSSSRRWGCGDSSRRWHSADSTGLWRDPEYQLPRRLRRAADFGGGALGGRRTRPVLLSIGAKSSSARGGAVAAHFLVLNLRSRIQTGLTYTRGSTASHATSSLLMSVKPTACHWPPYRAARPKRQQPAGVKGRVASARSSV